MKNAKISRRSFLLGLAACSAAGVLTACKGTDAPSGSTASSAAEQPASSAASSTVQQAAPFLTLEDFPPLDGSTACIPLMAQMLADTTGMDLEEARSSITVSTTAYAWENFGLYDTTTRMLVVYEAPDYVKEELQEANVELEQKPKALREALLLGKWDAFDGQAFPEFVDDPAHYEDGLYTHVIKPFKIPWHWTRVVSFDHGYTRPFSFGVWAVDEEGRVYRYKELYGCVPGEANVGVTCPPGEIARQLADLMEPEFEEGIHVSGIADPAIWDRSRGLSVEEQIRKVFNGVIFMKGDNTRLPGKMQLHERLKFDEEGRPMLYVFENCRDFRRTIPALVYDARRPEDIDTAGEDHIYDECRYVLMENPISPRQIQKETVLRDDPLDLDKHKSRTHVMRV